MKALVLKEYGRFSFEDVPAPVIKPKEVLVRVGACGICGSDVHGMDGSTGRRRPPIIMGHEAAGIIAETGAEVSGWKVGDRVTFDSTVYCGYCDFCRGGEINLCDNRRVLGVSCEEYRQHGAFAEFVSVPQHILYKLPDAVSFEAAAMVEPFSIALHAIRRCSPELNDSALVIGAGMIGIALTQALRNTGCGRIFVADVAADRLALASKMGATEVIDSSRKPIHESINALTDGRGADLAYEAVGLSVTVDSAIRSVKKGGSVVLVGNVTPKVEFPLQAAVTREISIFGSCASQGEYPAVLGMFARGALDPGALISAQPPLEEGPSWFARLYKREPGLLKVVLKP